MDESMLVDLGMNAARVATQDAERIAAIAEERAAAADLLDRVVEITRPALRALSSRVQATSSSSGLATNRQRESETFHAWRGMRVAGNGCEEDFPRSDAGAYEGDKLFLRADGTWAKIYYVGQWSRYQGSSTWWTTTDGREHGDLAELDEDNRIATWRDMSTLEVVTSHKLEEIVRVIADGLIAQLSGKNVERATAARARAAKLRAVAELLGGAK